MNKRRFFHRQAFLALVFCPLIYLSISTVEFTQPKLFKAAEYQLTPQFFRFISAGFWPATADLLWLQILQKIGPGLNSQDAMKEVLGFYRLATSLDPYFYVLYDQAAVTFSFIYEAPYPAIEMIDRGIRIYEKGKYPKKFWTHPYSLFLYRAYVNAFIRNDWSAAKADYLKTADMPGAPPYLQLMKVWLKEEGSEKKLAVKVLKVLINSTNDPLVKSKYQEKIKLYE